MSQSVSQLVTDHRVYYVNKYHRDLFEIDIKKDLLIAVEYRIRSQIEKQA